MNIYLDIDGVLIHDSLKNYQKIANGVVDFLRVITEKHNCYWLTTHCKGDTIHTLEYLNDRLPIEARQYINLIKSTDWRTWKTEAIDFSEDFRWIDDETYEPELEKLREHHCEDKLIRVNLEQNPNSLIEIGKLINKND
ncbi:MAG: hypothetical protein Q7S77_01810 [Candidatus Staskawiczbacteria bacterium]|nr:hypothetical protein [Candidatus Staskawiczbacteria bacterium]